MKRVLVVVLLLATQWVMASDLMVKVIELHYKTADQVIPLLDSVLADEGRLSGQGKTLVVKTTAHNLSQIRYVLHKLDKPPVVFTIRLKQAPKQSTNLGEVLEFTTQSTSHQRRFQQVSVVNGQAAFINTQKNVPVIQSVGVGLWAGIDPGLRNYDNGFVDFARKDINDGFWVEPELQGGKVLLKMYRLRERIDRFQPQQFDAQTIKTTMLVPMNKWVPLGATQAAEPQIKDAFVFQTGDRFDENSTLYIKVTIANDKPASSLRK